MNEEERIRTVYRKRRCKVREPYSELFYYEREMEIDKVIRLERYHSLKGKKILDVGCGHGAILSFFLKLEALPENLYGIDLLPERIEEAKKLYPKMNFICGNGDQLPYPDNFFDIVGQFTVFTSILDAEMKKNGCL